MRHSDRIEHSRRGGVGPNPVLTINRDLIEKSGERTAEELIRKTTVAGPNGGPDLKQWEWQHTGGRDDSLIRDRARAGDARPFLVADQSFEKSPPRP
jgi:hypothetical protein